MVFGFLLFLPYLSLRTRCSAKRCMAFYAIGASWLLLYFSFAPISLNPHRHEFALGAHLFRNVYLGFKEELLRFFFQPLRMYGGEIFRYFS